MIRDLLRATVIFFALAFVYAEVAEHDAYTLQEQSQ